MSLPTYPFARERYWVETASEGRFPGRSVSVLHPLLHGNTSDLNQQRYSSTFSGEEFFLRDHQVKVKGNAAHKVLPGVAYLEMARAAVEQAWPDRPETAGMELRNTVWTQPVMVADKKQVHVGLVVNEQDQIEYEIYSQEAEGETIHCQGTAVWSEAATPAPLDLEHLQRQMEGGELEAESVYAACARMGLVYGPAFQSVTRIDRGQGQAVAQL